jgi:hypothetical protein
MDINTDAGTNEVTTPAEIQLDIEGVNYHPNPTDYPIGSRILWQLNDDGGEFDSKIAEYLENDYVRMTTVNEDKQVDAHIESVFINAIVAENGTEVVSLPPRPSKKEDAPADEAPMASNLVDEVFGNFAFTPVINQQDHPAGTRMLVERAGMFLIAGAPDHDITILEWSGLGSKFRSRVNNGGNVAWHVPGDYLIVKLLNVDGTPREEEPKMVRPSPELTPVDTRILFSDGTNDNVVYEGVVTEWIEQHGGLAIRNKSNNETIVVTTESIELKGILGKVDDPQVTFLDPDVYTVGQRLLVVPVQGVRIPTPVTILRWGKDAPHQSNDRVRLLFDEQGTDTWDSLDDFVILKELDRQRLNPEDHPVGTTVMVFTKIGEDRIGPINVVIEQYDLRNRNVFVRLGNNANLTEAARKHFQNGLKSVVIKLSHTQFLKVMKQAPKKPVGSVTDVPVETPAVKVPVSNAASNSAKVDDTHMTDFFYHINELKRLGDKLGVKVEVTLS